MISFYVILFLYFAGLGANLSSLSPYLITHFGKNAEWVFISIQLMVPVGTLFAGWISDKSKKIRVFLYFGMFFTFPAQYFLFSFSESWELTLICAGTLRFLLSANYQWMVIGALEKMGESNFSKIRSSGTLGFLIIQIALFLLTHPEWQIFDSPEIAGKFGSFFYLAPLFFLHSIPAERISEQEYKFKDAYDFILNKNIILFFLLSFFFYSAYQVTDNYLGRYFQLSYGLGSVYLSWVFAVLLEIPFLLSVTRIVHKFHFFSLFYISILAGFVRFLFLSFSVSGVSIEAILFFQLPHAIFFAGYYMGTIHFLRKMVPTHIYGSVYGLYSIFSMSLGGMAGNLISGALLYSELGNKIYKILELYNRRADLINFLPVFIFVSIVLLGILPFFIVLNQRLKKDFM
jgi:MFS family permease